MNIATMKISIGKDITETPLAIGNSGKRNYKKELGRKPRNPRKLFQMSRSGPEKP